VQVFRLVTEHTIEEKIVERAQQKLKLDAMVVQSGRLKDKDKLSNEELLQAIRFGADKVFKTKDSSITDDDIDLILDQGRKKTEEMNEKLQGAEKGDMYDFKMDAGFNTQTFEGIDYSDASTRASMLGLFDIGKRERKKVNNYSEDYLAGGGGTDAVRNDVNRETMFPRHLKLPKIEVRGSEKRSNDAYSNDAGNENHASFDFCTRRPVPANRRNISHPFFNYTHRSWQDWHLYQKMRLEELQEQELVTFRGMCADGRFEGLRSNHPVFQNMTLLDERDQAEKEELLKEGFPKWTRRDYNAFVRASSRHGRNAYERIVAEVGTKTLEGVQEYVDAFWSSSTRNNRIPDKEYDRVVNIITKGEEKLAQVISMDRCTKLLLNSYSNPWEELEFNNTSAKDKGFTPEEDRYLLCWVRKYGHGQWEAIRLAIRRCDKFRFSFYIRAMSAESIGKRCEQLMRACEREVEAIQKKTWEMMTEEERNNLKPADIVIRSQEEQMAAELADATRKRAMKETEYKNTIKQTDEEIKKLADKQVELQKLDNAEIAAAGGIEAFEKLGANDGGGAAVVGMSMGSTPPKAKGVSGQAQQVSEQDLPELLGMIARAEHKGIKVIVEMFTSKFPLVSKRQAQLKIETVGVREKRIGDARQVWHIRDEFLHLMNDETNAYIAARPVVMTSATTSTGKRGGSKRKASKKKVVDEYEEDDDYDVSMGPPKDAKKAFTHFCNSTRKDVKASLPEADRKNKDLVNGQLKARWERLTDNELRKWKFAQEKDERRFVKQNALWEKQVEADEKAEAARRKKRGPIVYGRPVVVQVQVGGEKLVGRTHASVGGPPKPEGQVVKEQETSITATTTTTAAAPVQPTAMKVEPALPVAPPATPAVQAAPVVQAVPAAVTQPTPSALPVAPPVVPLSAPSASATTTTTVPTTGMKRERDESNGNGGRGGAPLPNAAAPAEYQIPKKQKH